jgi:hypothetical protein
MESTKVIATFCYALENQIRFLCRDLDSKDFRWRSEVNSPAIGWIVGHVLLSHDLIIGQRILGKPSGLPKTFPENFGMGSKGDFPDTYSPEFLSNQFKQTNATIAEGLTASQDSLLDDFPLDTAGFPPNWLNKNNLKIFVLHFNHVFSHAGQILEIRRLMGREVWGF